MDSKTQRSGAKEQDRLRVRTQVAQGLGLAGPEKVELVVLPAAEVKMVPVTRARKDELATSIEAEFYARKDRTKVPQTSTPLDDASILAVCGTCRGACCKAGEGHAFLTRSVLSRVRVEQRLATDAALLESYLDHVPEVAREGSCIFHGALGCALPRAMRSETCNRFLCFPLKQLGRDFGRPGYAQLAVSTVGDDDDEGDRMLLLSNGETCPFQLERDPN
ncbi:MAG: hypothetical protein ACRBN8_01895 [Nannocystales bacterium]